jgi:hypothetical protein
MKLSLQQKKCILPGVVSESSIHNLILISNQARAICQCIYVFVYSSDNSKTQNVFVILLAKFLALLCVSLTRSSLSTFQMCTVVPV